MAEQLPFHRFIGISLAGGKTHKTSLAVLDYFPSHEKVFLSKIITGMGELDGVSGDDLLLEEIKDLKSKKTHVGLDVPLTLPRCITCKIACPGIEACKVKEVVWMRNYHNKRSKTKRPNKLFTPYTERCIETFLTDGLEEPFNLSHSLGANAAPLTARSLFLQKRLKLSLSEVQPKVSVWRIGRSLKVAKGHLRLYRQSASGEEGRLAFMNALSEKKKIFIYQQDFKKLVSSHIDFDALVVALTIYLKFHGQCEEKPKGFPQKSAWIEFPKKKIEW